ncbi:DUF1918 domain-containing protein [Saccharothrix longispora]|uniref:DUF1918 domain-containing protein n=1 Tax=Saccharothrix longispora TaxID=33920 RepID=UPI0028FD6EBF|nr:DUF1918 domain-containing protein [Saccharothrix longispora]MBY8847880.1 DUF1918 domain-containing protein [Saccharothrix sp. MB29]MDU0291816.1 DUF1918 domain-containing protein [Saccharothrix longispora]
MHATVGDRLHVHSRSVGLDENIGEILEVRGSEGAPPYLVRFPDGHEGLVYPGPTSLVKPRTPESPRLKDSTPAR